MPSQPQQRSVSSSITVLALVVMLGIVLIQLFVSPHGLRKSRELQVALDDTKLAIDALEQRNAALAGEVRNLKHGLDAAEERARSDLGMIGENESFYQIVDSDAASVSRVVD
ncbi:MAG: septum formation initiator family protein [Pseudomonadota bacterium]